MENVAVNELKEMFEKQLEYQWEVRATTAVQRIDKLAKLKDVLLRRLDDIVEAAISDFARPIDEAKHQVYAVTQSIDHIIAHLEEWMQPEEYASEEGSTAKAIYEPRGLVCIFGTWNAPLSVTVHPLTEAVAAGNCVVIKPSEFTPAYSQIIKDVLSEVFDEREVAVVLGEADVAAELLELPFNHFFFTGGEKVGKIIMQGAAKHLAAVTLELGGKSPAILDRHIDLSRTAQRLAYGKIMMGGQFCICPDYIFVPAEDVDAFVQSYEGVVQALLYEDGKIRTTERTQIVNEMHYNRLKNLLDDAMSKGATVLSGGTLNDELRLIEPTILGHVTDDMKIVQEEIFGPLTFLKPYTETAEVIRYIRQRPKPLALYIFSEDKEFQNRILANTSSGGVTINDIALHNIHPELPFGGINQSGLGHFHGQHGFKTFSHLRAVYTVEDTSQ
ncbi:aldehyde dehydrogenase family protein [Lysinibacillus odysseyi]|uniref:Aldehyde dehydrogenase n=1 Tax=Lysinibacillus odysseyi 34hs-1 = NBRC 100172 TaxID=1220589 RepID=A0A0A3IN63_9BACI|nr:aldehyde dehydrogenase family protein [Lysinibacillus odysseyi]KGR84895.1 aldehyde dehydrogenase [Lysinibacillus odysseyi 34hs-1 = NBRC 100172]